MANVMHELKKKLDESLLHCMIHQATMLVEHFKNFKALTVQRNYYVDTRRHFRKTVFYKTGFSASMLCHGLK